MAQLIPNLGSCSWDSSGERRFAERLLSHLEGDYICWFNVPIGTKRMHPDFVILHPRRGILVLEVKDWKLDTIQTINKNDATLLTNRGAVTTANPLKQARQYAQLLNLILQRDPQLVRDEGSSHSGKLAFPWGYGAVLTNISRKQFDATDLCEAMSPDSVLCKDEMLETISAEEFQQRLWNMFTQVFPCVLTLPQLDRIRWHLYPEVRVSQKLMGNLEETESRQFSSEAIPDLVHVMDMNQEQLARSMGEGHRIIHGVAGSGKTMILGFRCQYLAQVVRKPILVLCFNKALASKLDLGIKEKQLGDRVVVRHFHRWCRDQLVAYHVPLPTGPDFHDELVERLIAAVDKGQVPRAQYDAVMIDEGHDFEPHWLKLVVQMLSPESNSLLLLYDDAQSLYGSNRKSFRFSEVGIQARGRSTILRLNYRNTAEVLAVAYRFAKDAIPPTESEDDGIPIVSPQSAGRHGPVPILVKLPDVVREIAYIKDRITEFRSAGHPWGDMAILFRRRDQGQRLEAELKHAGIPVALQGSPTWDAGPDTLKLLTMHSSKGLEFPIVIVAGVCEVPADPATSSNEAKLLYVAMTRSMLHLEMTFHRHTALTSKISAAIAEVA